MYITTTWGDESTDYMFIMVGGGRCNLSIGFTGSPMLYLGCPRQGCLVVKMKQNISCLFRLRYILKIGLPTRCGDFRGGIDP